MPENKLNNWCTDRIIWSDWNHITKNSLYKNKTIFADYYCTLKIAFWK